MFHHFYVIKGYENHTAMAEEWDVRDSYKKRTGGDEEERLKEERMMT